MYFSDALFELQIGYEPLQKVVGSFMSSQSPSKFIKLYNSCKPSPQTVYDYELKKSRKTVEFCNPWDSRIVFFKSIMRVFRVRASETYVSPLSLKESPAYTTGISFIPFLCNTF